MKRAFRLLLLVPVVVVIVALSVANRGSVIFSIDPFGGNDPAFSFSAPLYWLLFAAVGLGILIGGIATWARQSKWRRTARLEHAEIERIKREREQARTEAVSLPSHVDRRPIA
ncbi:MAG: LapA family protein [Alphaproteobacteria bacterium]